MKKLILLCHVMLSACICHAQEAIIDEDAPINALYEDIDYSFDEPFVRLNPYGRNELAALIKFPTQKKAEISLKIAGRDEAKAVETHFKGFQTEHVIPVLGLYPDYKNHITITAHYEDGQKEEKTVIIPTAKINKRTLIVPESKKDNQTNYYFLHDGVVFDEEGWIRFSFDNDNEAVYLMGNELIAEDRNTGLTRYSLLGKKEQHYPFPQNFTSFAHGLGQKPNGNYLIIGSFTGEKARFDNQEQITQREFVIEIDYKTGALVNTIDFAELLNPDRSVIVSSATQKYGMNDWCHMNSVEYDAHDESIIISCRHAGLAKFDEKTKALKWIFSPHKGFEKSGRQGAGPALTNLLLHGTDQNGVVYEEAVQRGEKKVPDFKIPLKTHHFAVAGKNIYSVFDNSGDVFDKSIITTKNANAAVFQVNEENKTVSSLWFEALPYSADSASSVVYEPQKNSVTVYLSTVPDKNQTGISYGKLIRFDLKTHEKLFEAVVYRGGETYFYRAEPFTFYANE